MTTSSMPAAPMGVTSPAVGAPVRAIDRRRARLRLPAAFQVDAPCASRLLGLVDEPTMARLKPRLELVHLARREMLFRAQEPIPAVYFPCTAVVSLVSRLESGEMLEVGFVGCDGLAGAAVPAGITTMPCDGIVQVPGLALRMNAEALRREVSASETLFSLVSRFQQVLLARSMQMSICNTFHSVEQRCVRWLLGVSDLIAQESVPLTHDLLATMLGVHRPTVTVVIRSLHRRGLVEEERGSVTIRDRTRLVLVGCECYGVMRETQSRLLGY